MALARLRARVQKTPCVGAISGLVKLIIVGAAALDSQPIVSQRVASIAGIVGNAGSLAQLLPRNELLGAFLRAGAPANNSGDISALPRHLLWLICVRVKKPEARGDDDER